MNPQCEARGPEQHVALKLVEDRGDDLPTLGFDEMLDERSHRERLREVLVKVRWAAGWSKSMRAALTLAQTRPSSQSRLVGGEMLPSMAPGR